MGEMSMNPLDDHEIRYQVSQIKELPPLPQSLKRLIEIIHSEIETPGESKALSATIPRSWPMFSSVANSTYYGYRGQREDGFKSNIGCRGQPSKSICICSLLMSLLSNGHVVSVAHREMLWKHAFFCSRIAAEMTRKRPWMSWAEAAVLGIVHDLGWIVMATHFNEQFAAIFETAARKNIPPWYVETQYGLDHSRLGKYLATRWAFPEEFVAVIEFHHSPERSKFFKTEVRLMHLVNVLSHLREYPELVNEESTLCQCRDLYISDEEWEEYQESVEKIWPEVEQLWNLLGGHPG